MKDRIVLRDDLLVFLRHAKEAVPSRELAARFLAIPRADEETCRRLLSPLLDGVRGLEHRAGAGWIFTGSAGTPGAIDADPAPADPVPSRRAAAPVVDDGETQALSRLDFAALATDGIGPGGSGAPRAVAIVPVVGGEALHEECFPQGGLDEEGGPVADFDPAALDARRGRAGFTTADLEGVAETVGDLPILAHRVSREVEPLRRAAALAGVAFHPRVISIARLGHLVCGLKANHLLAELASLLGVAADGPDDCRGRAMLLARVWEALVPALAAQGVETIDGLLEFQELASPPIDFAPYAFTAEELRLLPDSPGVYRFLDAGGATIYLGKAKNLRTRIGSYFVPSARRTPKGRAILERVRRLEVELVPSELEAILLEADLLLKERPPLNRQFEVSERSAPYGPRQNLVLVLRDAEAEACTAHFLRGGRYLRRISCAGDPTARSPAWEAIEAAVRGSYFSPAVEEPGGEMDWFLLGSYLRAHADEVSVLDVDECTGLDDALGRLRVLHQAALAGAGRVVAR